MTLLETIKQLGERNLTIKNDWYSWREINEFMLPHGIQLPQGNQYSKNIVLKEVLHSKWKNESDIKKRGDYIEYYIKTWGGIKGNSSHSMNEYRISNAEDLLNKGIKGIASWSKALVLHDYNKYAIFDARVSNSLNCLQVINSVNEKKLFPILPSQNKTIISSNKKLKIISKSEKWEIFNTSTFYTEYLKIIGDAARSLSTDLSTVEMLLFAKSEELTNLAFP